MATQKYKTKNIYATRTQAKMWQVAKGHDPFGANTFLSNDGINSNKLRGDPNNLIALFNGAHSANYTYIIWDPNRFSEVNRDPEDFSPHCDELTLGVFMLALEPGCYVLCSGWHANYSKPLGNPISRAVRVGGEEGEGLVREFESGTKVSWSKTAGIHIEWGA